MSSIIEYKNGELTGNKIAGFDLDDTLTSGQAITPYRGVKEKLKQLIKDGYNIVIVSNQKRRHIGDAKLLIKLEKVAEVLEIAFCARNEDENRKPNNGIISLIPEEYGKMEFFVGDAAGRPGDHSDCDKMFAINYKIPFHNSNEYFISKDTSIVSRDSIPESLV